VIGVSQLARSPEERRLTLDARGVPANPSVIIDATSWRSPDALRAAATLGDVGRIVILLADPSTPPVVTAAADVVLAEPDAGIADAIEVADPSAEAGRLTALITANARAAVTLVWLLRLGAHVRVADALAAESAAYSTLLAGPDFRVWLAARGPARPAGPPERVRVSRTGDQLRITLARPGRRNAVDAAMRDALVAALQLAEWDTGLTVTIDADGPNFSAGGDLDEFGSTADPATAHLVRVAAGAGRILHGLRDRVSVSVHGDCIGAGLELPAFAGCVVGAPDSRFRLPEIAMGLIPGAGGTVSLPRRIGRARTAWLALSGDPIDVHTAAAWGLVDQLLDAPLGP
jgi:hypothetical protein